MKIRRGCPRHPKKAAFPGHMRGSLIWASSEAHLSLGSSRMDTSIDQWCTLGVSHLLNLISSQCAREWRHQTQRLQPRKDDPRSRSTEWHWEVSAAPLDAVVRVLDMTFCLEKKKQCHWHRRATGVVASWPKVDGLRWRVALVTETPIAGHRERRGQAGQDYRVTDPGCQFWASVLVAAAKMDVLRRAARGHRAPL